MRSSLVGCHNQQKRVPVGCSKMHLRSKHEDTVETGQEGTVQAMKSGPSAHTP
uniref:Uncharacterized protein n=1 Tax=Triticum urartu TaxID=4572 RepID=A0A8R7Q397_TRIUA